MRKKENGVMYYFWQTPLWLIIAGGATIGILLGSITRDSSLSTLWLLFLAGVVFIRLLAGHGIASFLLKALIVFLILTYWFLKLADL